MLAGILLGLGASACWAVANVAIQRSGHAVGPFRALFWAQVVGGIGLAGLALVYDVRTAPFTGAILGWMALAGVAALLAYVCLFYAFAHGRLSIAVPILSSWAVISAAFSVFLLQEQVRPVQLGGAALVVVGVLLLSRHAGGKRSAVTSPSSQASSGRTPLWLLASLGGAVGFGVLIPAMAQIAPATGKLGSICVVYGADILLGLPFVALWRIDLRPPSAAAAWIPLILAGLFETVGFACIALAGGHAPLAIVSPLASLASAFTVLYAWLVLKERPEPAVMVGAALACAGVVILAV
jgi:drug/metabolite transporter (DMT)-like permease